jgi:hypothetical protein
MLVWFLLVLVPISNSESLSGDSFPIALYFVVVVLMLLMSQYVVIVSLVVVRVVGHCCIVVLYCVVCRVVPS